MPTMSPPTQTPQPSVTIDAVGDVMLGWRVNTLVQTVDPEAPFAHVLTQFAHADAVVGNLECSLSDRGVPTKAKSPKDLKARREFLLQGSPEAAIGLAEAGFAAVTLANNHTFDYGSLAVYDTLAALHDNGIATAGAGEDAAQAWAPAIFERRGIRFALIGVSSIIPRGYAAGAHTPGIAPGRDMATGSVTTAYLKTLAQAIRELLSIPPADEERLAHAAIDDGAALVLGAHPHVLGPVERYGRGLIAYSLGNFVFDTEPGIQTYSAILEVTLRDGGVQAWRALPVRLEAGVPVPVSGAVADEVGRLLAGVETVVPPSPKPSPMTNARQGGAGRAGRTPGAEKSAMQRGSP